MSSSSGSPTPIRVAAFVLFAVAITGGFVWAARATTPGHYEALHLHVWAGWALLLVGGPALAHHLAATSKLRWTVAAAAVLALVGVLGVWAATGLALPADGLGPVEHFAREWKAFRMGMRVPRVVWVAPAALVGVLLPLLVVGGLALASRLDRLRAARWWGLTLTLLCVWAAVSGAGLPLVARDQIFSALAVHSAVGVFCLAAVGHHVLAVRLGKAGWSRAASLPITLGLLAAVAAGAVGGHRVEHLFPSMNREWAPGVTAASTPRNAAERADLLDPRSERPTLDPAVLRDSMTCMAAGCHPDIGREWAGSPHRFAATNAFYRAAVGDLLARGDRAGAVFCANCHDPERVLTGSIREAYTASGIPEGGSDGVSCLVCHGIVSVDSDPPGNGLFTVATAPPHTADVARFREDVALDPRRHREVLGVDSFVLSPMPCRSCHRLQLGRDHGVLAEGGVVLQNQGLPEGAPGADSITCEECHLPRIDREFDQYTHRIPGINVDQAAYTPLEDPLDAALVAAYTLAAGEQAGVAPRIDLDSPDWPLDPPPATYILGGGAGRILSLGVRARTTRERLTLDITTRNQRVGHDFPSGPLDLQQVWLEVRVTDATGRVLHHVGDLDADGAIVGDPPRLGGRELDAAGRDIQRHRLFEIARVEKRALFLGAAAQDEVGVDLPGDVAWPLEIRSRWLFRRANPRFARWALGGDEAGTGSPLPAHELVAHRSVVPAPE